MLLLKEPNELGCDNKHDTNGWVNLSVITVSIESFLQYSDGPLMQVVHRTLWERIIKQILMHKNKNVIQHRGEAGLNKDSL